MGSDTIKAINGDVTKTIRDTSTRASRSRCCRRFAWPAARSLYQATPDARLQSLAQRCGHQRQPLCMAAAMLCNACCDSPSCSRRATPLRARTACCRAPRTACDRKSADRYAIPDGGARSTRDRRRYGSMRHAGRHAIQSAACSRADAAADRSPWRESAPPIRQTRRAARGGDCSRRPKCGARAPPSAGSGRHRSPVWPAGANDRPPGYEA